MGSSCRLTAIELDIPISKLAGDLLDLRHRLQARAAPGGPEVEDDDLALVLRQVELRPAQELELEVGRGLADQGGFGARWPAARRWPESS